MTFLDLPEPENTERPGESEETDDTGGGAAESDESGQAGELPELDGLEKEIDDLLRDSESDAGVTTKFAGTITILLAKVHRGEKDAENDLYHAVCEQLEKTALKALAGFRRLQMEPADLIGQIFPKLFARLSNIEVENRHHFFATAFQRCRWAIFDKLKELRRDRDRTEPVTPELAGTDTGPVELVERGDLCEFLYETLDRLPENLRTIIEFRFQAGYGFRQIAEELSLPRSTVHDHYRKALKELKNLLPDGFEGRTT